MLDALRVPRAVTWLTVNRPFRLPIFNQMTYLLENVSKFSRSRNLQVRLTAPKFSRVLHKKLWSFIVSILDLQVWAKSWSRGQPDRFLDFSSFFKNLDFFREKSGVIFQGNYRYIPDSARPPSVENHFCSISPVPEIFSNSSPSVESQSLI